MSDGQGGGARQKRHYEAIHDEYEAHYFDPTALGYRAEFILNDLLRGLDLNGRDVADLAAGSGYNSLLTLERFPRVRLTGIDVSERACEAYRRTVGQQAIQADLTRPLTVECRFDALLVVGGLHHCVADLDQTLANCAGLLRPGGLLLMVEPNHRFALENVRRLWYRFDRYFDHLTESPLDHDELAERYSGSFAVESVRFFGGPAYFLILNSLVTRIPVPLKRALASLLWPVERAWNRLPGRAPFPAFAARWRRV